MKNYLYLAILGLFAASTLVASGHSDHKEHKKEEHKKEEHEKKEHEKKEHEKKEHEKK